MWRVLAVALGVAFAGPVAGQSSGAIDASMNTFFARWADNARLNGGEVAMFYAESVDYYGRRLTRPQVLQAKLAIARKWPRRVYRVAPGSVRSACNGSSCSVDLVLDWTVAQASGPSAAGASTVSLRLVRTAGGFSIVAENGVPLGRGER